MVLPKQCGANSYTLINTVATAGQDQPLGDDEKDAIAGEAKFMRGVALFELVNYYAQPYSNGNAGSQPGVPIITARCMLMMHRKTILQELQWKPSINR